jgi:hypothetical protein
MPQSWSDFRALNPMFGQLSREGVCRLVGTEDYLGEASKKH